MSCNGIFFFDQIRTLQEWITERVEIVPFESKEIEAGIQRLNSAHGFYATLDIISQHTGLTDDDLSQWSFKKFYTKVGYLSHKNAYQKRLSKLYNPKNA